MELSTQGLVTDGVGKLSSSLHSPVSPSRESLPLCLCLSTSLPAASFFSVSHSFILLLFPIIWLLPLGPLFQLLGRVKTVSLRTPPVFLSKAGKEDDISRIVSRLRNKTEKKTKKTM